VLTEIESFRALARYAPEAISRLPAVLDQIDLDQRIRMLAQTVTPATVRSVSSAIRAAVTFDRFRRSQLDARCGARALTSPATIMIRPSSFTFRNESEMGTVSSAVPVVISAIPARLVGSGRAGPFSTRRQTGG
jgi:hypothetical protein